MVSVSIYHELVYPYQAGGGEVQRWMVAKHMAAFGHRVRLIGYAMSGAKREERVEGVEIKRVGLCVDSAEHNFRRLPGALVMAKEAAGDDSDVIMANPFFPLPVVVPIAKLRGKKVIVTWDDVFGYKNYKQSKGALLGVMGALLERIGLSLSKHCDAVLCVSEATAQKLVAAGIDRKKITNIHSGVNPEDYAASRAKRIKQQIVYVGRHIEYKNVEDLLRAFAILRKKHGKLRLKVLGRGPLTASYKKLARSLGVARSVDFAGFASHEEKVKAISESVCLALPSSFEGFGLAPVEANMCGRPYVAYDIPATREVTAMTKGGLLAEHRSVFDMARKISYLVAHQREAGKLGATGRRNVMKQLTWERTARRVERAIEAIA